MLKRTEEELIDIQQTYCSYLEYDTFIRIYRMWVNDSRSLDFIKYLQNYIFINWLQQKDIIVSVANNDVF
jgi:hypothetical protein